MLSLTLFGPPQALFDGAVLTITRRKSRAALYYVASQVKPAARRQLMLLLWPDHTADTARHNLRTTIYSLRQALGETLVVEEDTLALAEDSVVDVRAFTAALVQPPADDATLAETLSLYQGEFLQGFDLADAPEFDDWMTVAREHYRRMAIRGFSEQSRRHEAAGRYADALAALSQALAIDAFQEDLQRAALRLHYLAGDRAGAIRRYEELGRLLETEMGVPPMAETQELHTSIIAGTLAVPAQQAAMPAHIVRRASPLVRTANAAALPFAGREAELQRLTELDNGRRLVVVEGEPGIGKTRLIEAYLAKRVEAAGEAGAPLLLVGRARELESRLPYQPLIEALRQVAGHAQWPMHQAALNLPVIWWTELARLVPELAPAAIPIPATSTTADEPRVWEAVHQFVTALAQQQAVALFLDDLHWADTATLGLLGYLVRQAASAGSAVTFLAAARAAALRSPLAVLEQALVREDLLVCLPLARLSADEVMALARQLSPSFGYPLGSWLQRGSEGNPFILAELLRYARDEGILLPQGEVNLGRLPDAPVVPQTVYRLIQARLEQLSEPARRVLDAAVAAGRQFEFEVAARAAALSDLAALDALDELRQARLVVETGQSGFAFDHALTMEVAYREVGELRHRLLHRRVADALETIHQASLDEITGVLAQHYTEGGVPAQAAKYAWRAGLRAAKLAAWHEAAEFFQQALVGAEPPHRTEVLAALGKALLHAGEVGRSLEALQQALALIRVSDDGNQAAPVVRLTADVLIQQARYGDAIELAQEMVQHADPTVRFTAEFLWGATLSLEGLDPEGATEHLAAAQAIVRSESGPESTAWLGQVEFELGNIDARQDRLQDAISHYQKTLAVTQAMATDEMERWHILAYNNLAYHLHLMGDNDQALEVAHAGANMARERGFIGLAPYLLSTLGEIALAQDDLATAEAYFSQGLAQAQRVGHPERIAGLTANLGLVAARRGQMALAVHRLSTALAQAEAVPSHFLAAQIRLWLAPLLPPEEARPHLAAVRSFVAAGKYRGLAAQLERIEGSTFKV